MQPNESLSTNVSRAGAEPARVECCEHKHSQPDAASPFRASLPEDHVLATLMDEHQRILGRLNRLEELLRSANGATEPPGDAQIQEIHEIGGQLIGVEPHHQREEQVLFPVLIALGIEGPPRMMELEHVELRRLKHSIRDKSEEMLATHGDHWRELARDARELVSMLRSHIHKEDEILYPMAFEEIAVESWIPMKARCDEIGYCCQAPASEVGT